MENFGTKSAGGSKPGDSSADDQDPIDLGQIPGSYDASFLMQIRSDVAWRRDRVNMGVRTMRATLAALATDPAPSVSQLACDPGA